MRKILFSCILLGTVIILFADNVFAIEPPAQISPADNSTVTSSTLNWQAPTYSLYSTNPYRVQVDNDQTFSSPNKNYYTKNNYYTPILDYGLWYWRVQAKDSTGTWSNWSGSWSFNLSATTTTSTPTATPSASPTTTPATFTISNIPDKIESAQSFTVSVSLNLPNNPNSNFYLKGAFRKAGSSNYFGLTKVSSSWIKNGSNYLNQLPVFLDSSGKWSGNVEIKPDTDDTGFSGEDEYIFKVGRYTDSGSGPTWSNEVSVNISHSVNQGTVDNPTPTEEIKINSPTPKKAVNLTSSVLATDINNIQISTSPAQVSEIVEVKSDRQENFLIYIGIVLIFLGLGLMAFLYHEKIFNKLR